MISVLVVDDTLELRNALERNLIANGFDVRVASSAREALEELRRRPADVLLTDLRLGEMDGMSLIEETHRISSRTRTILMSAYATARDQRVAKDLGVVGVLCKPFSVRELLAVLQRASDRATGLHGTVHGLALVDILQMFHYARSSILMRICGAIEGQILFRSGEIVHAECGALRGRSALDRLLTSGNGSVETLRPDEDLETTISESFEALILDSARRSDEARAVHT